MKELTIEEKARAYDEALERARTWKEKSGMPKDRQGILDDIFPELAESEDERIRKALISFLKRDFEKDTTIYDISVGDIITWLEKQSNTNEPINRDKFAQGILRGAAINLITWIDYNAAEGNMCLSNMECKDIEDSLVSGNWDKIYAYIKKKLEKQDEQKVDDKIKPKFQNGQWIVWQNKYYKVNDNGCGYELIDQNGLSTSLEYGTIDENAHLWNVVEDAKVGDVLVYKGNVKKSKIKYETICLFNNLNNAFFTFTRNSKGVEKYEVNVNIDYPDNTVPATKEQKEILFKVMTNAIYTVDF